MPIETIRAPLTRLFALPSWFIYLVLGYLVLIPIAIYLISRYQFNKIMRDVYGFPFGKEKEYFDLMLDEKKKNVKEIPEEEWNDKQGK